MTLFPFPPGQYVIRFDAVQEEFGLPITYQDSSESRDASQVTPTEATDLTLDERAMTLATAVTIDIDYFSRHSGSGGAGFPLFMWGTPGSEYHDGQGGAPSQTSDAGTAAGAGMGAGVLGGMSNGGQYGAEDDLSQEYDADQDPQDDWIEQDDPSDDSPWWSGSSGIEGEDVFEDPY